ncbi:MAG: tetrahydrofolate dehydrogenase/cyclohydrolase catalytic domain-containing protein [Holophagaceae bacterium]
MSNLTLSLDCQETSEHYRGVIEKNIEQLGQSPGLAVILGCSEEGCITYHRFLMKDCLDLGIRVQDIEVESGLELVKTVSRLNQDPKYQGIFVFYPLKYPGLKDDEIMDLLDPEKDIEGLHSTNIGYLNKFRKRMDGSDHRCMTPCTARAVVKTLKRGFGDQWLAGKTVLVINDSLRIGRPLTAMMANLKATPILCHQNTSVSHLERFVAMADVIVSAVPVPGYQIATSLIQDHALCFDLSGQGNFNFQELKARGIAHTDTSHNSIGKVTRMMALLNLTYAAGLK